MKVKVGGKSVEMEEGTSLRDFMESHGLLGVKAIVVLNDRVVRHEFWHETALGEGDCLELVSLVGGG